MSNKPIKTVTISNSMVSYVTFSGKYNLAFSILFCLLYYHAPKPFVVRINFIILENNIPNRQFKHTSNKCDYTSNVFSTILQLIYV